MPDTLDATNPLPADRRAALRALELAATLGHFGTSLDAVENERAILTDTAKKLESLMSFSSQSFFMVDEETFAFQLAWASEPEAGDRIADEVAILIEDRTFAWALGRNKPTVVSTSQGGQLLLHPLTTAAGPVGMFAGLVEDNPADLYADIGYYLITVILFASATLLENFRLFQHLEQSNATLEQQVAERTKALTTSNAQLTEALEENQRYRQYLETVFSSMLDPLITVDRERNIISLNTAAERFFGQQRENLIGMPFGKAFPHAAEAFTQVFASAIHKGQAVREFRTQYRTEGMDKVLILSCAPLIPQPTGQTQQGTETTEGGVLLIRDITRIVSLEKQLQARHSFRSIVGKSERMQKLYTLLESLAEVDTTVLVTGESGTGKELIAEALHHNGARAHGPLIKVNCTALSESLLESELFGHVRGAFTGAVADKAGRFEAAEGGTIFLDEIGDVSLRIQILLLRFLESKEFERVGDTVTRKADVRIVAATNANLVQKIHDGTFRADLYYRLNVMHVKLPALRERRDDIPLLASHFITLCNKELGTRISGISEDAMHFFMRHQWPGNVREFKHVIEHGCILARQGLIGTEHLTPEMLEQPPLPGMPHTPHLPVDGFPHAAHPVIPAHPRNHMERPVPAAQPPVPQYDRAGMMAPPAPRPAFHDLTPEDILDAIRIAGGNKAQAARLLGIGRATLYRKMHELGMPV
ncbi:sigma 54-interacting transcriptional regulator [Desulfovibrio mangrovi]|uniref:sigma-54 interaction domain-containing protein n=1 Tax=Desulfovibrio mangrovi TaxID=2976983 RepID=UPI0022456CCC|nr:sigma 54-interacting transcriptional regulator [Desulfovibrio mangrovi]UZP66091.1 sigma 54-interacting transcriptional regulator [Desulfovibrio mangrovi]